MQFIHSVDGKEGVEAMVAHLSAELTAGKKVLWLICGGSNIPLAKEAMDIVRAQAGEQLKNLTVGQTDERFGNVGHPDSNWQQMKEVRFNFEDVRALPILQDKPLEQTVREYAAVLDAAFKENNVVVAQFGIGADGHIAGMLPYTGGIEAEELVFGYESSPFVRITMTPLAFAHINTAYTFAFGESKRDAIERLHNEELSLVEEPCQILKEIPMSRFYSDQV